MRLAFVCGFLFALLLTLACGHTFPYRHYVLAPDASGEFRGELLGPKESDDLPVSLCAPDEQDKGKCVVLFRAVWDEIRKERVELLERLKACEEKEK